jgi:hypothetical protein
VSARAGRADEQGQRQCHLEDGGHRPESCGGRKTPRSRSARDERHACVKPARPAARPSHQPRASAPWRTKRHPSGTIAGEREHERSQDHGRQRGGRPPGHEYLPRPQGCSASASEALSNETKRPAPSRRCAFLPTEAARESVGATLKQTTSSTSMDSRSEAPTGENRWSRCGATPDTGSTAMPRPALSSGNFLADHHRSPSAARPGTRRPGAGADGPEPAGGAVGERIRRPGAAESTSVRSGTQTSAADPRSRPGAGRCHTDDLDRDPVDADRQSDDVRTEESARAKARSRRLHGHRTVRPLAKPTLLVIRTPRTSKKFALTSWPRADSRPRCRARPSRPSTAPGRPGPRCVHQA